jgi:adenylate cyclase
VSTFDGNELAGRAGTTRQRVERMVALGIVAPVDTGFRPPDVMRVRIAEALDGAGIGLDQLGQMIADGDYSMSWADDLFPQPVMMAGVTLRQACDELDLDLEVARRLFVVGWELGAPGPDDELREDDLELLRMAALAPAMSRDADELLGAVRYFGSNLRRVSESQMRVFREQVEEPMFASGRSPREVMDEIGKMAPPLMAVGERAVAMLHQRHIERFGLEEIVLNTERALAAAGLARRADHPSAIVFVDLSGYTSLTEREGDDVAIRLTDRFVESATVRADASGGRVVKTLGDGAMLHFPDPSAGATCALELLEEVPRLGPLGAHAGIDVGPVVFRDGDYFGRTVNLAARVAAIAGPGELLGTGAARDAALDVAWVEVGGSALKGIDGEVTLFRAGRL